MTERGILFSAPMVRALLAGTKTRTRRLVTPSTSDVDRATWARADLAKAWPDPGLGSGSYLKAPLLDIEGDPGDGRAERVRCRTKVGDRLYVKETFAPRYFDGGRPGYRADWSSAAADVAPEPTWRPSIFMPRALSRILLDVVAVRVERLQDISEADSIAEGLAPLPLQGGAPGCWWTGDVTAGQALHGRTARDAYRLLWDSINGERASWASNPWVWCVTFKRVEGA
jgi:hypothetical protein